MRVTELAGAMTRRFTLLATAACVLAAPAVADAQSARARCRDCERDDSIWIKTRARQEVLAARFDSLRWEFERTARTDAEREELRRELSAALRALQSAIGQERVVTGTLSPSRKAYVEAVRVGKGSVSIAYRAEPSGYLGVSFDGVNYEDYRDDERIIRFFQYPRIALVEPASPAERAGIRQGDTLLALNGMDVVRTGEISLTKILVPERRLDVRVRRDGDQKTLVVTVGSAPDYVVRRASPSIAVAPMAPRMQSGEGRRQQVRSPQAAPMPEAQPSVWVFSEGMGGARMETVTEGLGRALGVESGVLVVRAAPGSPAHESGLRDGDVIQSAGGQRVRSTRDLRLVLMSTRDDAVRLEIVREGKKREVIVRW